MDLALILYNIRSSHNVGSIFRTADGFAVSQIFIAGYTPYPTYIGDTRLPHIANKITHAIHKTALGAEKNVYFSVHNTIKSAIDDARNKGYKIASLEQSKKSIPINNFKASDKIALVIGNELTGIDKKTLQNSNFIIEIPMFGKKESFNASVSAAIAMYSIKFLK
jgi:tRNA G18 (ribose-2'-O)-methylase SpoU